MMKVLVTGAAGFIGSHLAERLASLGHDVRAVDDLSTGSRANMRGFADQIEFIEGDLADPDACRRAVRGAEVVFHQAAMPSIPRSIAEPARTHRANVDATFALLEASRQAGVRRLIYAASSSVYGATGELPRREQMPAQPQSLYAIQKHVGELYARQYATLYGLEVLSLRYFNVFGPRQDPDREYSAVIPRFITAMLDGERPQMFGDGGTSRDFTFVDNVVDANVLAMDGRPAAGEVVNVGSAERVSLNQLVAALNGILATDLQALYLPEREGDTRHSLADISLAAAVLGYRPRIGLEEGLARTVAALREGRGPSRSASSGTRVVA